MIQNTNGWMKLFETLLRDKNIKKIKFNIFINEK